MSVLVRSFVALLLLSSACVPAEKEENLGKRWDDTTVMGVIQEEGTLSLGVSLDSPTAVRGLPGPYDDFTHDFAAYLADVLGVDIRVVEVPFGQVQTGIDTGDIDIAFPAQTITEQLVRHQAFSDPLFVGHQRLLVPTGSSVESPADLAGQEVCAVLEDDIGYDPSVTDPSIDVTVESDPAFCAQRLADGEVAAVTAPDVVLAGILESTGPAYEIVGDQLTTQGFGVLLVTGASAWSDYVSLVLEQWIEEGGWEESYTLHLGDLGQDDGTPDLTVEEAAALYPSDS